MKYLKEKLKSVRVRLFISLCVVVAVIVIFLIVINNVVLESFYLYSKIKNVKLAYEKINFLYNTIENDSNVSFNLEDELYKIAAKNDFDILIMDNKSITTFSSNGNLTSVIDRINEMILSENVAHYSLDVKKQNNNRIIYQNNNITIRRIIDEKNNMNYIFLSSKLDNGNKLYIRIQVASIQESVKISNRLLVLIGRSININCKCFSFIYF